MAARIVFGLIYQERCLHGSYYIPTVYKRSKNGYHESPLRKVHPFCPPDDTYFLLSYDNDCIHIYLSSYILDKFHIYITCWIIPSGVGIVQ